MKTLFHLASCVMVVVGVLSDYSLDMALQGAIWMILVAIFWQLDDIRKK